MVDLVLENSSVPTVGFDGNGFGAFVKALDCDTEPSRDQTCETTYAETAFEKLNCVAGDFDRRIDDHMKVDWRALPL